MQKKIVSSKTLPLLYRLLPPILLSIITAITYWPSLHYAFQFDDIANIQKHFDIRSHSFFSLFFSGSRWISYWLNSIFYSIGKFDPFAYRVGSLLIHITNGALLFFIILFALMHSKGQHFFKRNALNIATITSMLFLLHPVQTQTVSYVIQSQLEGLACMAILSMVLTFLHLCYANTFIKKLVLTMLLFCIATISCCTKEIAIISPLLLLLVDWFFVSHGSWNSIKKRWWLHAGVFVLIVGIYLWFLKPSFFTNILCLNMEVKNNIGNIITENPQAKINTWSFFISQFKVILHYIWMFIWPFNISVEYDWVLARSFFALDCFLPFLTLVIIGLTIFRILYTHRTHVICFGALWFFICIAPRSSIIPSPELLVDYKTYTASIGWLLILACAIIKLIELIASKIKHQRTALQTRQARTVMASLLVIPLSLATWQRNFVWSSGTEFWMNIIKNAPYKARAYNNYAVELSQIYKRYEEAIPYFKKATQMDSTYPDPWNNVAVCYSHLNHLDQAIESLQQGLKINPYYPEGYNNLASFYLRKKEYDKVEKCLKTALQLRPHYGKAYFNMGRMYAEKNENKKALDAFKKACTIADLDNEFGYKTYGRAALNQKEFSDAIWAYHKALECNPTDTEVMFSLANAYYLSKQFGQSINTYKHILAHKPNDIRVWYNLGESYLMQENLKDALHCFKHIEPEWEKLPQVRIRLATCYEKMGNAPASLKELQILADNKRTSVKIRTQAKQLIGQLHDHYGSQLTTVA
jgi:tetratricopeptide (TPR) repeat protein